MYLLYSLKIAYLDNISPGQIDWFGGDLEAEKTGSACCGPGEPRLPDDAMATAADPMGTTYLDGWGAN